MSRTFATLVLALAIFASTIAPAQAALTSNLSIGSRGTQVTELQQKLSSLGYFTDQVTGYFGFVTLRAVIAYQRANNLFAAGWVGPQTRESLNRVATTDTTTTTVPTSGPTLVFNADKTTITAGETVRLTWDSTGASSCSASGDWSGKKMRDGSNRISRVNADKTFTLTCTGKTGTVSQSVHVTVLTTEPEPETPVAPTLTLSVDKSSIVSGDSAAVTWSAKDVNSCTGTGAWSGSFATSGKKVVAPSQTQTYGISCTGDGGTVSQSVTITVTAVVIKPAAPTLALSISKSALTAGDAATVTWSSTNATSCTASNGWSGTKGVSGSESVTPTANATYTLTCTGEGGTVTKSVSTTVSQPLPAPTLSLNANATSILSGSSVTLSWSSTNATSCTASGGWTGTKAISGSQALTLTSGQSFTLTCSGSGGSVTKNVSVGVTQPAAVPTLSLTSSSASIVSGQSATLSWASTNASTCTASGAWTGSKSTSGTQSVSPTANATYTIACTGDGGTVTKSVTVNVTQPAAAPTLSISFDKTSVTSGSLTTLYWETTNATTCTGSGAWTGQKVLLGGLAVYPTSNQTYTLTCTGAGGSVTKSATVTVTAAPTPAPTATFTSDKSTITSGQSATLSWSATNATDCVAGGGWWGGSRGTNGTQIVYPTSNATYTLTCTGAGGSITKSVPITVTAATQTTPAPTVTLTSDKSSITSGQSATLTWSTTNATSCTASGAWSGTKATSGTQSVSPTSASTYTLACVGTSGSASKSVTISVSTTQTSSSGTPRQWVGVAVDNQNSNAILDSFISLLGRNPDIVWANSDHSSWWAMDASLGGNFSGGYSPAKYAASKGIPILWTIPMVTAEGNLKDAAAGAYNEYYKNYARQLIAQYGTSKPIYLRPNNEFNGTWMPWSVASGQEANSAEAFRQYVNSFRSVSGNFKFEWNVQLAWDSGTNVPATYPGDAYVDFIGGDMYYFYLRGHPQNETDFWNWLVNHKVGLNWLASFASQHGKPIAISEWGEDSDQPAWINHMSNWIKSNNVAYQIYWNRNDDAGAMGSLTDGSRPLSRAAYKAQFGNGPIAGSTDGRSQLASALTALENVLNQLTVRIGR